MTRNLRLGKRPDHGGIVRPLATAALSAVALVALSTLLFADAAASPPPASAPDSAGAAVSSPGWVDRDGDGRHDRFRDADGDGVNDVTGERYRHRFGWADADEDRRNDRFRDEDGDGVNDLDAGFRDEDGDGRDENVLDEDGDGRNDVTGLAYARGELHGERYGFVREEPSRAVWIDEDGDGFADAPPGEQGRGPREDRFIDRDGDGLADGCWFQDGGFRHHRARGSQGGQGGGGPRGSGQGGAGHGG